MVIVSVALVAGCKKDAQGPGTPEAQPDAGAASETPASDTEQAHVVKDTEVAKGLAQPDLGSSTAAPGPATDDDSTAAKAPTVEDKCKAETKAFEAKTRKKLLEAKARGFNSQLKKTKALQMLTAAFLAASGDTCTSNPICGRCVRDRGKFDSMKDCAEKASKPKAILKCLEQK